MSDYAYDRETITQVFDAYWATYNKTPEPNVRHLVEVNPAGPGALDVAAMHAALWAHRQRVVDEVLTVLARQIGYGGSSIFPHEYAHHNYINGGDRPDRPPLTHAMAQAAVERFREDEKPCDCVLATSPEMGPHTRREHYADSCSGYPPCGGCLDCLSAMAAYSERKRAEEQKPQPADVEGPDAAFTE